MNLPEHRARARRCGATARTRGWRPTANGQRPPWPRGRCPSSRPSCATSPGRSRAGPRRLARGPDVEHAASRSLPSAFCPAGPSGNRPSSSVKCKRRLVGELDQELRHAPAKDRPGDARKPAAAGPAAIRTRALLPPGSPGPTPSGNSGNSRSFDSPPSDAGACRGRSPPATAPSVRVARPAIDATCAVGRQRLIGVAPASSRRSASPSVLAATSVKSSR